MSCSKIRKKRKHNQKRKLQGSRHAQRRNRTGLTVKQEQDIKTNNKISWRKTRQNERHRPQGRRNTKANTTKDSPRITINYLENKWLWIKQLNQRKVGSNIKKIIWAECLKNTQTQLLIYIKALKTVKIKSLW